jgi:hypothetical protein
MNDRAMIQDIARQGRIRDSLRRQKVDFYISSKRPGPDGCVLLREPEQAGSRAPRMTETVCKAPVFTNQTAWIATAIWNARDGFE